MAAPRPRKRVCGGAKFLAPPYYSQRAVFASPPSAFLLHDVVQDRSVDDGHGDCKVKQQASGGVICTSFNSDAAVRQQATTAQQRRPRSTVKSLSLSRCLSFVDKKSSSKAMITSSQPVYAYTAAVMGLLACPSYRRRRQLKKASVAIGSSSRHSMCDTV